MITILLLSVHCHPELNCYKICYTVSMKKYLELFKVTVDQYFVYRLNFILWRFRVILNIILIYFLWTALYQNSNRLFGYSEDQMLTYVLLISIFSDFVFSSRIHELGAEILNGDIINRLLKPMGFFKYLITKEIADKTINISFALAEVTLLVLLLKPNIQLPIDGLSVLLIILHIIIGLALSFFLSFSVSMIAFWTAEIWAPRFIYFILVFVLAGNYFPLDILPKTFYSLLLLTPFPYFIFIPAQIYIKGSAGYNPLLLIGGLIWIIIAYFFSRWLWGKGIKEYSFYGR